MEVPPHNFKFELKVKLGRDEVAREVFPRSRRLMEKGIVESNVNVQHKK
jgi:hypothetical protein